MSNSSRLLRPSATAASSASVIHKPLFAAHFPDIKVTHQDTRKVYLAKLVQELYNSQPMYYLDRRVNHHFNAYRKLSPALQTAWNGLFGKPDEKPDKKPDAKVQHVAAFGEIGFGAFESCL